MIDRSLMFKLSYWLLEISWFTLLCLISVYVVSKLWSFQDGSYCLGLFPLHITYFKVFIKLFSEWISHWVFWLLIALASFLSFLLNIYFGGCANCGAWASHCGDLLLQALGAPASVVVAYGLSCYEACWIFLDQDQTCLLHQLPDSQPTEPPGKSLNGFLNIGILQVFVILPCRPLFPFLCLSQTQRHKHTPTHKISLESESKQIKERRCIGVAQFRRTSFLTRTDSLVTLDVFSLTTYSSGNYAKLIFYQHLI